MEGIYDFVRSLWVVWLMLIFVGIVAWAYWPSRRRRLQKHANIPLEDDRKRPKGKDTADADKG